MLLVILAKDGLDFSSSLTAFQQRIKERFKIESSFTEIEKVLLEIEEEQVEEKVKFLDEIKDYPDDYFDGY